MRRYFLTIVCLLTSVVMLAGHVTEEQAEAIARTFLSNHHETKVNGRCQGEGVSAARMRMVKRQPLSVSNVAESTAYYVFNVGEEEGYVIVSGDDHAPQVLGYAPKGTFDESTLPANMKDWLEGYVEQIGWLQQTDGAYSQPRRAVSRPAVAPLLKTKWNQRDPYNQECPYIGDKRALTGCTATAMAQCIARYRYPNQTLAPIPGYTTKTLGITSSSIEVTTIDWDHMLNDYLTDATTEEQQAVSNLMLLCAQSIEMDFQENGSSAAIRPVATALQRYFGYSKTCHVIQRYLFTANEWDELIYDELSAGRPVLYSGRTSTSGHTFVIDGYDSAGLFHINWGWGGNSDNYFVLSVANPYSNDGAGASSSKDGYSISQEAMVGIQYESDAVFTDRLTATECSLTNGKSATVTRTSADQDFSGTSVTFIMMNRTGETHSFQHHLRVYDANGNVVKAQASSIGSKEDIAYLSGIAWNYNSLRFGANLPDGDYYIVPVCKNEVANDFAECWGTHAVRAKATIAGNTMTLSFPTVALSGTMQTTGLTRQHLSLPLEAQVTNNGTYFSNYLYLLADGNMVGGRIFEAESGETRPFVIDFIPTTTGTQTLELCYRTSNDYVVIASQTVTVEAEGNIDLSTTVSIENNVEGVVQSPTAHAKMLVTNNGDEYINGVGLYIFKLNPVDNIFYGFNRKSATVTLAPGASTTVYMDFDGLENGARYQLRPQHMKGGKWVYTNDTRTRFNVSYTLDAISPIVAPYGTSVSDVYTISGVKIGAVTPEEVTQLPRGIYIVNGKKVVR